MTSRKFKLCCFIFTFYFACCYNVTAQWNDAGMRISITGEKKITSKLRTAFTLENRANDNFGRWSTVFVNVKAQYKINKALTASLSYRYIMRNPAEENTEFRHRIFADLSYRIKFSKLTITPRTRIQSQFTQHYANDISERINWLWRNKITAKYSHNKWNPYIEGEIFYTLNNNRGNTINRWRTVAGCEYELSKKTTLDIFYLRDNRMNVNNPLTLNVFGAGYTFSF